MTPNPPALETAAASGPPEVRAMPARRMGYLMPRSLQRGVERGGGDIVMMMEVVTSKCRACDGFVSRLDVRLGGEDSGWSWLAVATYIDCLLPVIFRSH